MGGDSSPASSLSSCPGSSQSTTPPPRAPCPDAALLLGLGTSGRHYLPAPGDHDVGLGPGREPRQHQEEGRQWGRRDGDWVLSLQPLILSLPWGQGCSMTLAGFLICEMGIITPTSHGRPKLNKVASRRGEVPDPGPGP